MALASSDSISCPQCGGANALPAGETFVRCQFCDATLYLDRSGVVGHYGLPRLLDAAQAQAALRRWMAGNETVKDLDRRASLGALRAVSFPMWLFRTRGARGEKVWVEPAAPTPIPQLADLEVPAGRLEPFTVETDGVEATAVTVPLETARDWLAQRDAGEVSETSLVHVPLWRCPYSYDGGSFQALVDASTGKVLASVYPEKAESPYYLVAILGLLLFGVEGLLFSNLLLKLAAYLATGIPLSLLAYWVTRKV